MSLRFASGFATATVLFFSSGLTSYAQSPARPVNPACTAPQEFSRLGHTLARTARALVSGKQLTIVALGSSSTAGAGATAPGNTYPSRLEAELKAQFPQAPIKVLNRGVGGEDAVQMLGRLDHDVVAEQPDLIIWQVGTNAVLQDHKLSGEAPLIREGIARMKATGADVVLMDSQYAPKVIAKPDAAGMLRLIGAEAKANSTGLFQRFAIMQKWHTEDGIPFATSLSPDGLHMNDWSYGCIARLLSAAIVDAVRGPAVARAATPRPAVR